MCGWCLLEQFREEQIVSSGGENGIQHHLPGSAMVGMVESVGGEQVLGVAGDQYIGLHLSDDAHHVTAQVQVWDQRAVISVQEVNRFCPNHGGSRIFFLCRKSHSSSPGISWLWSLRPLSPQVSR